MIDRLIDNINETGNPSVVGLDPTLDLVPPALQARYFEQWGETPEAVGRLFLAFNREILDGIAGSVPAVKPQIAMYERYGLPGIACYLATVAYARDKGFVVIGDIKRGDIGSTAEAYASHLGGVRIGASWHDPWQEDAVTVNPFFGTDGIEPFLAACRQRQADGREGRGLFVLVRTSNPSSAELQELQVAGGAWYEAVADRVAAWGEGLIGIHGYSQVGAVVGATWPEQGEQLRARLPHTFFLVPGYGAQGGKAADLAGFFDGRGSGAIVNSSRGILAAWKDDPACQTPEEAAAGFGAAAGRAAAAMARELRAALVAAGKVPGGAR